MNKIISQISASALIVSMVASCSPDDNSLGSINVQSSDLVEGIAFEIQHDAENPNIVYLVNKMGSGYTPLWNHPQGRSQDNKVTLQIPFAGEYEVTFGVETRGGVVYGDPVQFTVEGMCADFISDPLWTLIAGGGGKSKKWYLDLDSEGVSRHFKAPLYFFTGEGKEDPAYCWDNLHTAGGDNYLDSDAWDATAAIVPNLTADGSATWYWLADYPGNSWMCALPSSEFGTMTFDLIGGAHVVVDQEDYGNGKTEGQFMLDAKAHTISFTDCRPLCVSERFSELDAATGYNILYASEDFLQIMILPSGTCMNYISEDYRKNWVPEEVEEVNEPTLPDGWMSDISQTVSTKIVWKFSEQNPLDWATMKGEMMNGWSAPGDYPDWLGTPDASVYGAFSMTLDSSDGSAEFALLDGSKVTCNYTLDEKGIYSFTEAVPSVSLVGWANFEADANNQLRIMKIEKDAVGNVSGMWLGKKDPVKDEYMAYHLEPSAGSGSAELTFTELAFDNSKIVFGHLESDKNNLRIEILNAYGSTNDDSPIVASDVVFSNRLEVKFKLSGISFKEGAAGSYATGLGFVNSDWSFQYWGDGKKAGDVNVKGDGSYTVYFDGASSNGITVFVIDIISIFDEIVDPAAVTAEIEHIRMY